MTIVASKVALNNILDCYYQTIRKTGVIFQKDPNKK